MRLRGVALLAGGLVLAACAHDRGWHGDNAVPFDAAQAQCDARSRDLPAGKQREDAFDACMQEQGWRRP